MCLGFRPFLCIRSCVLDSDLSWICVLVISVFSLSMILSIGHWFVMYLCVGAIGLLSVYDLVYWTVTGHVFVCWGYQPFLCLRSCLLDYRIVFSILLLLLVRCKNSYFIYIYIYIEFVFWQIWPGGFTKLVTLIIIKNKTDTIYNRTSPRLAGFSLTLSTVDLS